MTLTETVVGLKERMPPGFWGVFTYIMDEKGRLVVPPDWRDYVSGSELVVTVGPDRSLSVYLPGQWDQILRRAVNEKDPELREQLLRFVGPWDVCKPDSQSRITVPKPLMLWADIKPSELVLAGAGPKYDIWSQAQWLSQAKNRYTSSTVRVMWNKASHSN